MKKEKSFRKNSIIYYKESILYFKVYQKLSNETEIFIYLKESFIIKAKKFYLIKKRYIPNIFVLCKLEKH